MQSYCLLMLLRDVVSGLRGVPAEVLDAADGIGFGPWCRLWRIELPLALPMILSGPAPGPPDMAAPVIANA
jgi:osmoprotectant transport system permease protein